MKRIGLNRVYTNARSKEAHELERRLSKSTEVTRCPVNFEVNNTTYLLAFNEDEGEWVLLTPVGDGFDRLPVHNDAAPIERVFFSPDEDAGHQPVN
jgi:hypothetical protein